MVTIQLNALHVLSIVYPNRNSRILIKSTDRNEIIAMVNRVNQSSILKNGRLKIDTYRLNQRVNNNRRVC